MDIPAECRRLVQDYLQENGTLLAAGSQRTSS